MALILTSLLRLLQQPRTPPPRSLGTSREPFIQASHRKHKVLASLVAPGLRSRNRPMIAEFGRVRQVLIALVRLERQWTRARGLGAALHGAELAIPSLQQ